MVKQTYEGLFKELTSLCSDLAELYELKKISWYMVEVWTLGENSRELFDIFDESILWFDDEYTVPPGVMLKINDIQNQLKKINDFLLSL